MNIPRTNTLLALAFATLSWIPVDVSAQSAQDTLAGFWDMSNNPFGLVTGFASLDWGSSMDAIVSEWGAPDGTLAQDGVQILAYEDQQVGGVEPALMYFWVHPKMGLGRGAYFAVMPSEQWARAAYRSWEEAVSEKFVGVTAIRCQPNDTDEMCERFGAYEPIPPIETLHWISLPDYINLGLKEARGDWIVTLTYTSGAFEDLVVNPQEQEKERF